MLSATRWARTEDREKCNLFEGLKEDMIPAATSATIAYGEAVNRETSTRELSSNRMNRLRGQNGSRSLSISPEGCRRRNNMEHI